MLSDIAVSVITALVRARRWRYVQKGPLVSDFAMVAEVNKTIYSTIMVSIHLELGPSSIAYNPHPHSQCNRAHTRSNFK